MSSVAGPHGPSGPRRLRPVPNPPQQQSALPPQTAPRSTAVESTASEPGATVAGAPGSDAVRRALRAFTAPTPVMLDEGAAPARLAPFAVRLDLEVPANALDYPRLARAAAPADEDDTEEPLATGRFVLLHDPRCPVEWEGVFRIVAFLRASVDASMAADPTLTLVAWDWLVEQLEHHHAGAIAAAGTVTRTASQSFGRLEQRPALDTVEIRASWTIDPRPHGMDLAAIGATADRHVAAFCGLALQAVGLPQF